VTARAKHADRRAGVTLLELLVVLAILGVMAGITGLAFRTPHQTPTETERASERIAAARHEAIVTGHDVTTEVMLDEQPHAVTAHADGRVVADALPALDPLSGHPMMPERADARP
jgi:prepilin-type N-terminal cleavage/methylation domain-containing protein